MYLQRLTIALIAVFLAMPAAAQITLSRDANLSVDVAADGRLAIDLRGDIWVVPGGGGDAVPVTQGMLAAKRPRWSPDATQLVFQVSGSDKPGLWVYDFESNQSRRISAEARIDRHPTWHPSGDRVAYSSAQNGSGFDLWETDLTSGIHWRLTHRSGDETEPAWSANGRDLVYVHHEKGLWSLVLRRFGQRDEALIRSTQRIAAPSWRPDGSLITFLRYHNGAPRLEMVILSRPRLVRTYADREGFHATPVSWLNRHRMYFAANGYVRQQRFDSWSSRPVNFRALVQPPETAPVERTRPTLPWIDEPTGTLVIRAGRLFDGVSSGYRRDQDIVIEGGRITAVESRADRSGQIVVDMGDLAVLPGYIDADARLPSTLSPGHGPDLLTMGITTIVADVDDAAALNALWSGKGTPGPRLLSGPEWRIGPQPPAELDVTSAVTTSGSTGRTSGIALPLQIRSMEVAGLSGEQTLRAIGVNAAAAMLADPYLGRVAVGAAADLVLVDGDPLADAGDALNIVAVVRNGRFYSVSGLIDRAKAAESVE